MTKKTTFTVTLPDGKKAIRSSARAYTHSVAVLFAGDENRKAGWQAMSFHSGLDNAEKASREWAKAASKISEIKIIPVDGSGEAEVKVQPAKKNLGEIHMEHLIRTAQPMIDETGVALPNTGFNKTILKNDAISKIINWVKIDEQTSRSIPNGMVWNFDFNGKRYSLVLAKPTNSKYRAVKLSWDHRDDMTAVIAALTVSDLWEGVPITNPVAHDNTYTTKQGIKIVTGKTPRI